MPDPTQTSPERFAPNLELDASIEAKIARAFAEGIDLTELDAASPASASVLSSIGITSAEHRYMAEQHIFQMTKMVLGQKIVETLNANGMRMAREDLVPCLNAYFEAVDSGELPAAA